MSRRVTYLTGARGAENRGQTAGAYVAARVVDDPLQRRTFAYIDGEITEPLRASESNACEGEAGG